MITSWDNLRVRNGGTNIPQIPKVKPHSSLHVDGTLISTTCHLHPTMFNNKHFQTRHTATLTEISMKKQTVWEIWGRLWLTGVQLQRLSGGVPLRVWTRVTDRRKLSWLVNTDIMLPEPMSLPQAWQSHRSIWEKKWHFCSQRSTLIINAPPSHTHPMIISLYSGMQNEILGKSKALLSLQTPLHWKLTWLVKKTLYVSYGWVGVNLEEDKLTLIVDLPLLAVFHCEAV